MAAGAGASEASPKMYRQSGRPDVLEGLEIEAVEAELPGLGRHPQVLAGPFGRLHGALEIIEIGSGDEPGIDAGLAAQQEDVEPVPAPDAVLASEPHLQREVALVLQRADTRRGQERACPRGGTAGGRDWDGRARWWRRRSRASPGCSRGPCPPAARSRSCAAPHRGSHGGELPRTLSWATSTLRAPSGPPDQASFLGPVQPESIAPARGCVPVLFRPRSSFTCGRARRPRRCWRPRARRRRARSPCR